MTNAECNDYLRGLLRIIKIYSTENESPDRIIGRIQERIERQLNVNQKTIE